MMAGQVVQFADMRHAHAERNGGATGPDRLAAIA
jgi:hypothetical protein